MTVIAGKYRLERVLGQGGMGVVVAAMHTVLDERVAIKLLLPEALASAETVMRFQREARAAVRIKSEHVARVIDVGTIDAGALEPRSSLTLSIGVSLVVGAPFMVMEYLDGQDLSGVLRAAGPLSILDATSYVAQAIEAIAEAHTLGIVHRDLKPSNLFLARRPDGTALVKVLDFGISKAAIPGFDNAAMTTTSTVLGSPMYMAPEQMIASREVDGRTDVWALGVVLYQLLSGRGPFAGTTMAELCARIIQEPHAPMRQMRPDVPVELELVVARCLEKERTRRFASVADLAEALAPFGGQSAALSAERARRLIPRTERAVIVPATDNNIQPIGAGVHGAMPYAATNPSWSATQGRSGSSSAIWVVLAVAMTGIVLCAAVVIFVLASHARQNARAASTAVAPEQTVVASPAPVELAPLHARESPTVSPGTQSPTRLGVVRAPAQAVTTPGIRPQPPLATTTAPTTTTPPPAPTKPDIF